MHSFSLFRLTKQNDHLPTMAPSWAAGGENGKVLARQLCPASKYNLLPC